MLYFKIFFLHIPLFLLIDLIVSIFTLISCIHFPFFKYILLCVYLWITYLNSFAYNCLSSHVSLLAFSFSRLLLSILARPTRLFKHGTSFSIPCCDVFIFHNAIFHNAIFHADDILRVLVPHCVHREPHGVFAALRE